MLQNWQNLTRSQLQMLFCRIKPTSSRYLCDFSFKHSFTNDEVRKILNTVNSSSLEELSRFSIAKSRVEKIIGWRSENGKFRELDCLLELDDFGGKILQKFCQSILKEDKKDQISKQKITRMVVPKLSEEARENIESCCSVQIGVDSVSWCRMTLQDEKSPTLVTHWHQRKFNTKNCHVLDLVEMILEVNEMIPDCDAFVLESPVNRPPSLSTSKTQITVNIEQSQILAMITLILSQRENSGVFFLRSYLAARLFGTLVGSERVSSGSTVTHLLENTLPQSTSEDPRGRIICPEDVLTRYRSVDGSDREFMARSLMLSLGFLKLCLIQCPASLAAVNKPK
ncbi:Transcription elongation factor, mitochondrial [Sergentomyia squamirostris]